MSSLPLSAVTPVPTGPDWDVDQLETILDPVDSWQLVIAGPGAGKSAVACQRIAFLLEAGVAAARILLVSFTRTAVAELRSRICSYAEPRARDSAKTIAIATIDSNAWSLRRFDDQPLPRSLGDGSYDLSIERVVRLFRERQPELLEYVQQLEHLIIDEAQDVVGIRAQLMLEMLSALSPECGVTILADPDQSIYGFTTDEEEGPAAGSALLDLLPVRVGRKMTERHLAHNHRVQRAPLLELFRATREAVESAGVATGYVSRIQETIRNTCLSDLGSTTYEDLASYLRTAPGESTLVLFRRRADVLFASSFCSHAEVAHRLRMSGLPTVVAPWIGWLLGEVVDLIITRDTFDRLWEQQAARASAPFLGTSRDDGWALLYQVAAGRRAGTIDLVQLRQQIARPRPPIELCLPELGHNGPILGTIHASKGREADSVVLVLPSSAQSERQNAEALLEEGRVYYVGATRARNTLTAAGNRSTPVEHLESGRIYRRLPANRAQIEVGRDGDVDRLAHLAWSDVRANQETLAACAGQVAPIEASTYEAQGYATRLVIGRKGSDGVTRCLQVGEMSESFRYDLKKVWFAVDGEQRLKPPLKIPHLYLFAVTTVALSEVQQGAVRGLHGRSGFGLMPIVRGFPTIQFVYRSSRRPT